MKKVIYEKTAAAGIKPAVFDSTKTGTPSPNALMCEAVHDYADFGVYADHNTFDGAITGIAISKASNFRFPQITGQEVINKD